MFLKNKYHKWYNNLIEKAKHRYIFDCGMEKHHIIPKSLGGTDNKDNLVNLTEREHYIAHLLLTRAVSGESRSKMITAFWFMSNLNGEHVSSKQFEIVKKEQRKIQSKRLKDLWNNPSSKYNQSDYASQAKIKQKQVQNQPEVKAKIFSKRAEVFHITDPDGNIFVVKGLSKFCREHHLHAGNMSWLASGKLRYYKGWNCIKSPMLNI